MRDVFGEIDLKRRLRDNGLSIVIFVLFAFSFGGQVFSGWFDYNREQLQAHQAAVDLPKYLASGHFVEATFENWESEFLQMGAYVALTAVLFQRGSPESNDPDKPRSETEPAPVPDSPRLAKSRGAVRWLYERSLSITLFGMFGLAFFAHAAGGMREFNEEQASHGAPPLSLGEFLRSAHFWFQSFQNWQSEFLSIGTLLVLGIYLRQKNSPTSKAVDAPHSKTGND